MSGPILALLLFAITPTVFSIPNILTVREMTSMMPAEGGYYHWPLAPSRPSCWLGAIMLLPLIAMSVVGIFQWITSGTTISFPFLPPGQDFTGALNVGLFVAIWNFMGYRSDPLLPDPSVGQAGRPGRRPI